MNSSLMIRQILDANKKVFEDSLDAIIAFQEQIEKMANIFWGKSAFFPHESKKIMDEWAMHYRNCLDDFRSNADKRFKLMEYYFLNTADQLESSMHTVVDKAVPVSQVYEVTKKTTTKRKKDETSDNKTVKKKKTTLKK